MYRINLLFTILLVLLLSIGYIACDDNGDNGYIITKEFPANVIKFFNGYGSIDTAEKVRVAIDNLADNCIRTVIIIARGDDVEGYSGKAYYDSSIITDIKGSDGSYLFEAAADYAKSKGLTVYAWIPLCRDEEKIASNSDFAAWHFDGNKNPIRSGSFICPGQKQVRDYIVDICKEVAEFTSVDGIIVDWVRYDGWDYCCCGYCRLEYSDIHNGLELIDVMRNAFSMKENNRFSVDGGYSAYPSNNNFYLNFVDLIRFRESRVTGLVSQIVDSISKPVGAFVFNRIDFSQCDSHSGEGKWFYEVAQNVPDFFSAGLDMVFPMVYYSDFEFRPGERWDREDAKCACQQMRDWCNGSHNLYFTFGDNPDGTSLPEITTLEEYEWLVDNIEPLGGGLVYYSNDGVMAESEGLQYLTRIKKAHDLGCEASTHR